MAEAPVTFQCTQCSAMFVRQDHLHRHELTHGQLKSCVCEFCSSRFHRRDILRRHYKNCKERGDRPIPSAQTRGRRRQACDRCALNKLACDLGQPCRQCASKNHTCSRSHGHPGPRSTTTDTVNVILEDQDDSHAGQGSQLLVSALERSPSLPQVLSRELEPVVSSASRQSIGHNAHAKTSLGYISAPFLSAVISADSLGFVDIFGFSSRPPEPLIEPPVPLISLRAQSTDVGQDYYLANRLSSNSPLSAQNVSFYSEMAPSFGSFGKDIMPTNTRMPETTQNLPESNALSSASRKVYELVMQLTNAFITLPKGHYAKTASMKIDQVDTFFTSSNVQVFIQTYFHHFHAHFSIVHRPSFNIETASLRLLLVVCLAGSLYSSLSHDISRGKTLLDLAEDFIFRDAALKRLAKGNFSSEAILADGICESNLEILQAGFLILVLQNWEGNPAARRRARIDRLHQLISLARALHLTTFQPSWLAPVDSSPGFDWIAFGRQESCIRIIYNLFIFDSTLCIFYNYPPKFALAEITANLPCAEKIFEATSRTECVKFLEESRQQQSCSLNTSIALLVSENVSAERKACLVELTPFHLFILIHAFHHIIWHSQNTNIPDPSPSPIVELALSRWKNLWDWGKQRISPRLLRQSGFTHHADEYWWLAQVKIHEGARVDELIFEDDQMLGIRRFMESFCTEPRVDDFEFAA